MKQTVKCEQTTIYMIKSGQKNEVSHFKGNGQYPIKWAAVERLKFKKKKKKTISK